MEGTLFADQFDGKRVLVVGGAGFVGSNLVRMLLNHSPGVQVDVIDNLMSAERENLPLGEERLNFIEGSISDDRIVNSVEDVYDYIWHLACYHGNQSSIHDPLADHENNTLTTLKLMERIHRFEKLVRLVYSSAGCSVAKKTFDDAEATTEEAPISLEQDSPYSLSKIFGEFYCFYYFRQFKTPVVRVRFQNVYGPGEVLGAGQWRGTPATVWRNVTPTFVYKALHDQPLPLENEGIASRDFIFVEDICRGLMAAGLKGETGEVYNLASGKDCTIRQLAETIVEITGSKGGIELKPKRAWDTSGKRYGSADKSRDQLGFEALKDFREGLAETIAWTRENQGRIDACIAKHDAAMKAYVPRG